MFLPVKWGCGSSGGMSQIQEPAGTLQERRGVKRVLGTVGPDTQVLPAGTVPRQRRPAAATWGGCRPVSRFFSKTGRTLNCAGKIFPLLTVSNLIRNSVEADGSGSMV